MIANILNKILYYAHYGRSFLLDIIFPIECLSCKKEGLWVCDDCFEKIIIKHSQNCLVCGKNNFSGSFCKECKKNLELDGMLIASNYSDALLSKMIKTYKYKFAKDLSLPLAQLLIKFIENLIKEGPKNYFWHQSGNAIVKQFSNNLIIPVPLFWKRKKWRGFNQSEELAKIFANYFNLKINTKNLQRKNFLRPQTKLNKNKRFANIKDNFLWNGENLSGKHIILIDDVSTSTATLNECAKVLKKSGAKKVWGLVIGHG